MDGNSGDEGNDELTCVRSDKSDKSSQVFMIIQRYSLTDEPGAIKCTYSWNKYSMRGYRYSVWHFLSVDLSALLAWLTFFPMRQRETCL